MQLLLLTTLKSIIEISEKNDSQRKSFMLALILTIFSAKLMAIPQTQMNNLANQGDAISQVLNSSYSIMSELDLLISRTVLNQKNLTEDGQQIINIDELKLQRTNINDVVNAYSHVLTAEQRESAMYLQKQINRTISYGSHISLSRAKSEMINIARNSATLCRTLDSIYYDYSNLCHSAENHYKKGGFIERIHPSNN